MDNFQLFFHWYGKTYKTFSISFIVNGYMKHVLNISPKELRSKKKPKSLIDLKNILMLDFERVIKSNRDKVEKLSSTTYHYIS